MNKITKNLLLVGILVVIFFLNNPQEYWKFHRKITKSEIIHLDEKSQDTWIIKSTPDMGFLDLIITEINSSQQEIYIQTYILTETRIQDALLRAAQRGVEVHILLERLVFGNTNINLKAYNKLKDSPIHLYWSDNDRFTFTHTKTILIDYQYIIGTGNLSYSSFKHNRELWIHGHNPHVYSDLKTILTNDNLRSYEISWLTGAPLILSPINSRSRIISLLESATEYIYMHAQSLSDPEIMQALIRQNNNGIEVRILMGNTKKNPNNANEITHLSESGIKVQTPLKPFTHAKTINIDGKTGYIGSANFTSNSLENNREIGLVLNENQTKQLEKVFKKDWKNK